MNPRVRAAYIAPGLAGNLLILGSLALGGILAALAPEQHYRAVQEDGYVEWASFWAFALAAVAFIAAASRERRAAHRVPWFALCLGAFCCFVALEEISWGQRVIGFRPPALFLERNFQQELNFHNIVSSRYRKLAVEFVILTYGVLLPLAAQMRRVGPWLERWGALAPPFALVPAFAVMLGVYAWYPWDFTGEWVELALGLAFLFAASGGARRDDARWREHPARGGSRIVVAFVAVIGLGTATAVLQSARASSDPARVAAARAELSALSADLTHLLTGSRCGIHKRLYTLASDRGWDTLHAGQLARLAARGVPQARIQYLLDPWNSPYWLRDRCVDQAEGHRLAYVYSFGPDRRRDSNARGIAGDDIGIMLEFQRLNE
ncbi:MAG: hypothetical protein ACT4O5_11015 [Gammaproteobacteria bacterium]